MPRKLRLEYAGGMLPRHQMRLRRTSRGNYRRDMFAGKGTAESFEQCLFEAAGRFGWRLHAYVVMRNHDLHDLAFLIRHCGAKSVEDIEQIFTTFYGDSLDSKQRLVADRALELAYAPDQPTTEKPV